MNTPHTQMTETYHPPEGLFSQLKQLWKSFLPLSLSDISMACSDPLIMASMANAPETRANIAALGVGKSIAVFFESPIIMILHAATTFSWHHNSRKVLWRFVKLLGGGLSLMMCLMSLPWVFAMLGSTLFNLTPDMAERTQTLLQYLVIWPAVIAWRRFYQGWLISQGHSGAVGRSSMARLASVLIILAVGIYWDWSGLTLAGTTLIGSVIVEAVMVTQYAYRLGFAQARHDAVVTPINHSTKKARPTVSSIKNLSIFYWPLANSMVVVWGARMLLLAVIARAHDGLFALAIWPFAWALVLVVANATRMVQQVTITNREHYTDNLLLTFGFSVGCLFSLILFLLGGTPLGDDALRLLSANDPELIAGILNILLLCSLVPMLVAIQNVLQGFLISSGQTRPIQMSTLYGSALLLIMAWLLMSAGVNGAVAATLAMLSALLLEIACLFLNWRKQLLLEPYHRN